MGAGISTVIWATGYSFDFSLVRLPIFDGDGYPIQKRGTTGYPGLYFVGMPWLHNAKSGLVSGVAQDASHVAGHIATAINAEMPRRPLPKQSDIRGESRVPGFYEAHSADLEALL